MSIDETKRKISELLPCPFCGANPNLETESGVTGVVCSTDACVLGNTLIHPVAWNKRALSASHTEQAAEIERLGRENEKLHDALHEIEQWARAYPLKAFPEPTADDWKGIADVLHKAGYSLDCVSASNMRHVITKVGEIAREALRK